jgi:hypothetical protein
MSKQKLEVEVEVPDGYKAVAYRVPLANEWCLYQGSPFLTSVDWDSTNPRRARFILRKIEPEIRTMWVNAYPRPNSDGLHESKAAADRAACSNRIACVEVKYEVPRE